MNDFRSTKPFDYISATKNLTETEKKNKAIQLRWFRNNQWLCDKYRELEKRLDRICDEKQAGEKGTAAEDGDKRTCLPFPKSNNDTYGWLARRPEFQLDIYGSLVIRYPNPMDEIVLLTGDMPTLGGGKGFF